ncbi:hypothetical protein BJV82DRAFT_602955 [Fennellomyces sp. T-0311]|nr:hypothetical protein BJV82DRAFT_602955 [Fennellomyces sp. T-0311]
MLRCQRSIPPLSRRLFHASRATFNNAPSWTRSGLMRLRKVQLEELARQQKMSTNGTKSDIVERLLQREDTAEARVHDAVSKQASQEKNLPGNKQTPVESLSQDVNTHVAQETTRHSEDMNKEVEATNWVEAFELKLGNSRVRSPRQSSMFSSSKQNRPPRPAMEPQQQEPRKVKDDEPVPDDVDKAWVQAFEQKANNRELRSRVLGTDTFRASQHLEPSGLDFIQKTEETKEQKKEAKEAEPHPQLQQSAGWGERDNKSTRSSWMINSLVGSGLMVWLVSGESGFQSLAAFLTSSS